MLSYFQYLLEIFSKKQKELLITKFGNDSEKYIDQFDELRSKNRKEVKGVDITKFKSLDELKNFLDSVGASKSEQVKQIKDTGVDLVFENDKVYVYHIKTKEAACQYGSNTKWCITQKDKTYWEDYIEQDVTFYFIISKNPSGDSLDKIAVNVYPAQLTKQDLPDSDDWFVLGKNIIQMWNNQDDNISSKFNSITKQLGIPSNIFKEIEDTSPFVIVKDKKFRYTEQDGVRIYKDISIIGMTLTKIPNFGDNYIVTGNFDCNDNQLTTLEGSPNSVGGYFDCNNNQLISLKGAPNTVNGDFYCHENQLINLKGGPKTVNGDFYCSYNQLTSLEGSPNSVGGSFNCFYNQLTSLEGSPNSVGGSFNCSGNKLTSLEGSPNSVGGSFNCSHNRLVTLEGSPNSVGGSFYCSYNQLTSLEGAPNTVNGDFIID